MVACASADASSPSDAKKASEKVWGAGLGTDAGGTAEFVAGEVEIFEESEDLDGAGDEGVGFRGDGAVS